MPVDSDDMCVLRLAWELLRDLDQPYDAAVMRNLCDAVERILEQHLETEPTWPADAWLDGLVADDVERSPGELVLRGHEWIAAVRVEPCEVRIAIAAGRPGFTILFGDKRNEKPGGEHVRLRKFPSVDWRYSIEVNEHDGEATS